LNTRLPLPNFEFIIAGSSICKFIGCDLSNSPFAKALQMALVAGKEQASTPRPTY
jgi:hypothetical protein